MNIDKNEFRKYAVKHHRIGSQHVDSFIARTETSIPTNLTPYIVEERQLNVAQMDVFSRLMMDRIIFLGSGIDDQVANIIQAQLLFLQSTDAQRDIQIYINSPGGSVYAGLGIYDTMQYITPDVAALRHSRVMIHQPSGGAQGVAADMEINLREMMKLKEELYTIISDHSGQTYEWVEKSSDRDYWMRANEAKEFGMIDEILLPKKEIIK